jgi:MinD superfamily P-loop ATPase
MSTPRHPPIDRSPCDRCGKLFNHTELDAVFLCEDRSIASEEAYCKTCFPHMRVFAWDYWQSLEPVSW